MDLTWITLWVMVLVTGVVGEVRLVCPRPQSPNSAISQAPCGPNAFRSHSFDTDFTEVHAGPLTVVIEDTVFRRGSSSRISLGQWGSDPRCVLLDHIPSRDVAVDGPECPLHEYGLGECKHRLRYITVHIPDIKCERCYLQLMTVNPSSTQKCIEDHTNKVNCTTHYSCSNIRILPSNIGEKKTLFDCQNYVANLNGYWPYQEKLHFQANINHPQFQKSNVKISMDRHYLKYDILLKTENLSIDTSKDLVSLVKKPRNNTVFVIFLERLKLTGKFKAFTNLINELQSDNLAVRFSLSRSEELFYRFDLTSVGKSYIPKVYTFHTQPYSEAGWLEGSDFVGPTAIYPGALKPSGLCVSETRSYGTLLHDNDHTLRAIINRDIYDNKLHITGIFSNKVSYSSPIIFSTPLHVTDKKTMQIGPGVFMEDILPSAVLSLDKPWSEVKNMTRVTTEVSVYGSNVLLVGSSYKSLKIMNAVEDEFFAVHANIITNPKNTWTITVMIIRKNVNNKKLDGTVSVQHPSGQVTINSHVSESFGHWVGTAYLHVKDSQLPLYLWEGLLTLHTEIKYESDIFIMPTVQFEQLRYWHCEDIESPLCWKTELWVSGKKSDLNVEIVPSHGLATFYIPKVKNSFMYSVTVNEISSQDQIEKVTLTSRHNKTVLDLNFGIPSKHKKRSLTIHGQSILSPLDIEKIIQGHTYLTVHTTENVLSGRILPQNTAMKLTEVTTPKPLTTKTQLSSHFIGDVKAPTTTPNDATANNILSKRIIYVCLFIYAIAKCY